MLFLGLSGNVHASPLSMTHCLDTDISSLNSKSDQRDFGGYRSFGRSDARESPFAHAWYFDSRFSYNEDHRHHIAAWNSPWKGNDVPTKPSPVLSPVASPVRNVPDGGSTAIMLGAVMTGLVYMKKKSRA